MIPVHKFIAAALTVAALGGLASCQSTWLLSRLVCSR